MQASKSGRPTVRSTYGTAVSFACIAQQSHRLSRVSRAHPKFRQIHVERSNPGRDEELLLVFDFVGVGLTVGCTVAVLYRYTYYVVVPIKSNRKWIINDARCRVHGDDGGDGDRERERATEQHGNGFVCKLPRRHHRVTSEPISPHRA
jgi:hypothetical protein